MNCINFAVLRNSYGHPAAEAVEHIETAGAKIYYTMDSGQVTVRLGEDGQSILAHIDNEDNAKCNDKKCSDT